MRVSLSASLLAVSAVLPATAWTPSTTTKTDTICSSGLKKLTRAALDGSLKAALARKGVPQTCDIGKAARREEYSLMSNEKKLAYTNAVKCLMNSPSKIPAGLAPGAHSRYDDFVATHANLTVYVHDNGNFLAWHRYYIWSFERALQDECGYKGYLPYWNWAKSSQDVLNSPYFDGSELSQGGNGIWAPHNCTRIKPFLPCLAPVVEGRGGGCVEAGPYAGIVQNVSAIDVWFNAPNEPVGKPLSYQPRCMKRDISPEIAVTNNDDSVARVIDNSPDIATFQRLLQTGDGPHGNGHFTFGGNPGGDIWVSPGDPMFWLHHAAIDRAWWCWQNQDIATRMFQINGTRTMANNPPSDPATIDDPMWLDFITPAGMGPTDPQFNHVSSFGGQYCYVYVDDGVCKKKKRRNTLARSF